MVLSIFSICVMILYYQNHPSDLERLIGRLIFKSTGISASADELTYSLRPLRISAKGITLKRKSHDDKATLYISNLDADLAIEGNFGNKRLIIEPLEIDGFSLELGQYPINLISGQESGKSSFLRVIGRKIVSFFLFKDIDFRKLSISGGDLLVGAKDRLITARDIKVEIKPKEEMEISCSAEVDWRSEGLSLLIPDVRFSSNHGISLDDPKIKGTIFIGAGMVTGPLGVISDINGLTDLIYEPNKGRLTISSINLALKDISLTEGSVLPGATAGDLNVQGSLVYNSSTERLVIEDFKLTPRESVRASLMDDTVKMFNKKTQRTEGKVDLSNLSLQTKGEFILSDHTLKFSYFNLNIKDTLESAGSAELVIEPSINIELNLSECRFQTERIIPFLPSNIKEKISHFNPSGPMDVEGSIRLGEDDERNNITCDLKTRFNKIFYEIGGEKFKLKGIITGEAQGIGTLPDLVATADIEFMENTFTGENIDVESFSTGFKISGQYPVFQIKELVTVMPRSMIAFGGRDLSVQDIRVYTRQGDINITDQTLVFPDIQIESSWFRTMKTALEVKNEGVSFMVKGGQTDVFKAPLYQTFMPSGWKLKGVENIEVEGSLVDKSHLSFHSRFEMKGLNFENNDSRFIGENISFDLDLNGKVDLNKNNIATNTRLEVYDGELLLNRFYTDFTDNRFSSNIIADYNLSQKFLHLSKFDAALKDILSIRMKGELDNDHRPPNMKISLDIADTPLKPIFDHFIYEPLNTEKPVLSEIAVSGDISTKLEISIKENDPTVKGSFFLKNSDISYKNNRLSFRSIDLDLPIYYKQGRPDVMDSPIKGELSIDSISVHMIPEQGISLSLEAGPNLLKIPSQTTLKVSGGTVNIAPLIIKDIFTSKPKAETAITINNIDLDTLISGFIPYSVGGKINGTLEPLILEGSAITTKGEITATPFNGEITLSHIGAEGIFGSSPVFKLDTTWKDLNLSDITTGTSFGKIRGILSGYVNNLEIAHGQPQRFDLLLETVKRDNVPQRISIKAVDNIAMIGGGQSPFIGLAGTFASLFKEFPYEKIGIQSSLENDVFKINGTIKENGLEYIIKRGGFSGVNIVNQNPGNRISFKDMVKRIQRINAKGVSPVID
ncbi:hypothetical protein ACFL1Z_03525 [Thermodesulfobacteriota bacterium]